MGFSEGIAFATANDRICGCTNQQSRFDVRERTMSFCRARSALRMAQLGAMMALPITLAATLGIGSAAASTLVQTTNGSVQGKTVGSVDQWLGIRYAASPAGANRWKRPQPPGPYGAQQAPYDATHFGPPCPQNISQFAIRYRFRRRHTRSRAARIARTAFFSTSMLQPIGQMTRASGCPSSSGSMAALTSTARAAATIRRPSSPKATSSWSRSTIAWARSAGSPTRYWTTAPPSAQEIMG